MGLAEAGEPSFSSGVTVSVPASGVIASMRQLLPNRAKWLKSSSSLNTRLNAASTATRFLSPGALGAGASA